MSASSPEWLPIDDDARAQILLALTPDVGPILRGRLLERFGDAARVFAAGEADLQTVAGIGPKIARRILGARHEVQLDAQLAVAREHRLRILLPEWPGYPRSLKEIPDPPGVLFVRGELEPADGMAVAIVGTRRATHYGKQQAERLAAGLARAGLTVVSGMARGIDGAAHRGALAAGGRTIAVLASGVLNPFPPEHAKLADEIARVRGRGQRGGADDAAAGRDVSAAQSNHQRAVDGHDRRRSGRPQRRAHHRAACHGAGPRGVRRAGAGRQTPARRARTGCFATGRSW